MTIAVLVTLGVSAICSLLEAMVLSTTQTDIETLKKGRPKAGALLERYRSDIEETSSAILTLNTIANTLGAVLVGGMATRLFGDAVLGVVSAAMTLAILIFSEILPKNVGVHYRRILQPVLVYPLGLIRQLLKPVTFLTNGLVRLLLRKEPVDESAAGSEILLLAERGGQEGHLESGEVSLISNALSLSSVPVKEIMTPRPVVVGVREDERLIEVLQRMRTIRFGRMPVYAGDIDHVTGVVRRRDMLHAIANGDGDTMVGDLRQEAIFFTDFSSASEALQSLLTAHQQLGIVVNEFGACAGVITIEDVVEHLIGREIYENDDVAIDMRQLARLKSKLVGLRG
ncbi:MAG: CNNM domain-containing protein [Terrimicrobiaceae bacterium]|nr:CNNM domain-containing protein [Terrimicrobiaceae bacterium]